MATTLYARKEVAALPATLTPNTIYAVRRGLGFDLHISDNTGLIAHRLNNTDDPLKSPVMTYTAGQLTRIDYDDGSFKTFSYTAIGDVALIDFTKGGTTTRKTFNHDGNGVLVSIVQTVV
jgi:hypothetical protein